LIRLTLKLSRSGAGLDFLGRAKEINLAIPAFLTIFSQKGNETIKFWYSAAELLCGAAVLAFLTWIFFWLNLDIATTIPGYMLCCCPCGAE